MIFSLCHSELSKIVFSSMSFLFVVHARSRPTPVACPLLFCLLSYKCESWRVQRMIKRVCVGCVFPSFVKKNFRSYTTFGTAIVKDRVNVFFSFCCLVPPLSKSPKFGSTVIIVVKTCLIISRAILCT